MRFARKWTSGLRHSIFYSARKRECESLESAAPAAPYLRAGVEEACPAEGRGSRPLIAQEYSPRVFALGVRRMLELEDANT